MIIALLVVVPALLGLVTYFGKNVRSQLVVLIAVALLHFATVVGLWLGLPLTPWSVFGLDPTGRLFLTITSTLFVAASVYSIPYLIDGTHDAQAAPLRFVPCLLWFLAAMTLVAGTRHFAVMWAAVEATTLASAPLVYFYRRRAALEAAWKYLLICSVGIALALLGTFFIGIAASASPVPVTDLSIDVIVAAAPSMSRPWLEAGFVLALVGYGTKMGLAPLHTWLPDTHSQAPSPVSALLSGSLLNCALLALLRFYNLCVASGDAAFARNLLLLLGFTSLGVSAALMIGQRDYKRLFAYSSIENMGIIAVGVGLAGVASQGAMLHVVNHSVCKAALFLVAGNVLRSYGSTDVREVRGIFRRQPRTGVLLAVLLFAIGGTPPFGPFGSELMIFRGAMALSPWMGVLFVVLLAVAFLGMAGAVLPMLQGDPGPVVARVKARDHALSIGAPLALAAASLVLGVWVPGFLEDAVRAAAHMIGGP